MRTLLILLSFPLIASATDVVPKNEWVPSWQNPANGFQIKKNSLGSGAPSRSVTAGVDVAAPVADGYYHVPGFMPGHPTAATLYPQVQSVDCTKVGEKMVCDGYQVNRSTGHGEYLYVVPNLKEEPPRIEVPPVIISPPVEPPKVSKPRKPRPKKVPRPRTDLLLTPEKHIQCK